MTSGTAAAWQPSPVRPLSRSDLYIALAVFVLSWVASAFYLPAFRAGGGRAEFYQEEFAPAVMSACGRGYVSPAAASTPPSLQAFLERRAGAFNCADLPATMSTLPLTTMQAAFRYLMLSTSLVWRIRGVSWNAIDTLLSALFAISITGGYVALRLVSGPILSVFGTLLWLGSPMHLGNLPHLRDYSKASFFIVMLVVIAIVSRERRPSRLLLAGALFGVAQGIGFGMRTDVILNFAPFLLVLFAAGAGAIGDAIPAKAACAVAAFVAFAVVAWPLLGGYGGSEGLAHVGILGLTTPFDEPLGIRQAPYDFGYIYNDSFARAEVTGHWGRTQFGTTSIAPSAPAYAAASRAYYVKLATTFPGDFLTRMTGSVIQTLNLPFSVTYGRAPDGATGILGRLSEWRTLLMLSLIGTGPLVAFVLLVIVGASNIRDAAVGMVLLLFWTAYPFIQFHGRHTFHLEFMVIAGFMAMFSLIARGALRMAQGSFPRPWHVARAAGLVAALGVVWAAVLLTGRAVQTPQARALLSAYEQAAVEPLAPEARLFDPPGREARVQQTMIVVEASCPQAVVVSVRYQAPKDFDFTRPMTLPAKARAFLPVYAMDLPSGEPSRFTGVEGPACIHVSRIRGIDQLLWIDATLTPDWASAPAYQRVYLGTAFPVRVWLKIAHWWPSFTNLG
jgi:hypothetical protein